MLQNSSITIHSINLTTIYVNVIVLLLFAAKSGDLAYFFGPIGIIVLCNIILFIATAIRLIRLKKETKMLKGGESKRHDDDAERQR